MANEPEREIEKTLKTYAKERGDAAPTELHPATRKLLLGEAARAYPVARAGESFWAHWLGGSRMRLAAGLGLPMVLIATGLFFWMMNSRQSQHELQLTMNRRMLKGVTEMPGKQEPAVASMEKDKGGKLDYTGKLAKTFAATTATLAKANVERKPTLLTATNQVAIDTLTLADTSRNLRAGSENVPVASPQPTAVSPSLASAPAISVLPGGGSAVVTNAIALGPAFTMAPADHSLGLVAALSRDFSRVRSKQVKKSGGADGDNAPALRSFRVEQTGNELRLVDSDGSVYSGHWEQAAEGHGAASGAIGKADYLFRVNGTNLSLNRKIVFTGRFEGEAMASGFGAAHKETSDEARTMAQATNWLNGRVYGRATMGSNQWDIVAKPSSEK